jgi:TetR/AcrR family transcriptional regulator
MVEEKTAKKSSLHDEAIAVATRLFAARGFEATPLQDIADALGVTKPAVLHHFPSKEHLRRGVLDAILAHWRDELPKLLLAATASEDRFESVLHEVYRFFAATPERARVIIREALDRPREARAMLAAIAPVLRGIASYIQMGVGGGRHRDGVDAEAYVLHAMQLLIAAASVAELTAGMLGDGAAGRARYDRELARIVRESLFALPSRTRKKRRRA